MALSVFKSLKFSVSQLVNQRSISEAGMNCWRDGHSAIQLSMRKIKKKVFKCLRIRKKKDWRQRLRKKSGEKKKKSDKNTKDNLATELYDKKNLWLKHHTVRSRDRKGLRLGSHIFMLGVDFQSLVKIIALKAWCASTAWITDLKDLRAKKNTDLKELSTAQTIKICKSINAMCATEKLNQSDRLVPNTMGALKPENTIKQNAYAICSGEQRVAVGTTASEIELSLIPVLLPEVAPKKYFLRCNDYLSALSLVASRRAKINRLFMRNSGMDTNNSISVPKRTYDAPNSENPAKAMENTVENAQAQKSDFSNTYKKRVAKKTRSRKTRKNKKK